MAAAKPRKRVSATKSFSLKDRLFNEETVELLANGLASAHAEFPAAEFKTRVLSQFEALELKACIECMADALLDYLPGSYSKAVSVLKRALPPPLDPTLMDDDFGLFIWAVPSEFAARHGCSSKRLRLSLSLLHATTQRFSAEFAIRPFLKAFPQETYEFLERCAEDDNYHVRRLASEGTRPTLPWGLSIDLSAEKTVAMLNRLHADPARFVTRSVANSLNDISKSEPDLVLSTLKRWAKAKSQDNAELEWMKRHALRGLVKADHGGALALLGYPVVPKFELFDVSCPKKVSVGDSLEWSARVVSQRAQKLKVLLRVHFLKANGSYSAKAFALKDLAVAKGEELKLSKRLPFKPMTTRALYPGEHHIELVINGKAVGKASFALRE